MVEATALPTVPQLQPEKTQLLRKVKYHCTADLLFDYFGRIQLLCFVELDRDLQVWFNPNQSNRRLAVQ